MYKVQLPWAAIERPSRDTEMPIELSTRYLGEKAFSLSQPSQYLTATLWSTQRNNWLSWVLLTSRFVSKINSCYWFKPLFGDDLLHKNKHLKHRHLIIMLSLYNACPLTRKEKNSVNWPVFLAVSALNKIFNCQFLYLLEKVHFQWLCGTI